MEIPEKIKVRIKKPNGNEIPLGFVTYVDSKGKLRKEVSWNGWGDSYHGEFSNEPKNGFKLENAVKRTGVWFGAGRTMFRLQHPDGFIFEITTDNFWEICNSCIISKGVIESKCILAWDGVALSLIPVDSELYQQQMKLKSDVEAGNTLELIIGKPYRNRKGEIIGYYAGTHVVANMKSKYDYITRPYIQKITFSHVHVFYSYSVINGHTTYDTVTLVSPVVFECTADETKEYEKTHVFDKDAINDVSLMNSEYHNYHDAYFVKKDADTKFFEKLCEYCSTGSYDCTIVHNKISDKYFTNTIPTTLTARK